MKKKSDLRVVVLTGNNIRHKYYASHMNQHLNLVGLITEPHAEYFNQQREDSIVVREHFERLGFYEQAYLGNDETVDAAHIKLNAKEINLDSNIEWVVNLRPDYILLYGTGILNAKWCETFSGRIINLHLGVSPYYRGSATLFWPFYNNEMEYVGTTVHLASVDVDAGDILKIVYADIEPQDNYYDITYKLIRKSIHAIPDILHDYHEDKIAPKKQDISKRKHYYRKKHFSESALKKVLSRYYDSTVNC